jgi:hypothetical protein
MSATEEQVIHNERELGRIVSIEDELARQRGHAPTWSYGSDADGLTAAAHCPGCGQRLACRVFTDGRVWSAGRLRVTRDCEGVSDTNG